MAELLWTIDGIKVRGHRDYQGAVSQYLGKLKQATLKRGVYSTVVCL